MKDATEKAEIEKLKKELDLAKEYRTNAKPKKKIGALTLLPV